MIDTDIGRLDRRIVIQKQLECTLDEYFNHTCGWTDYHSCWAAVSGVSGREYLKAREQHEENTVTFKVRWCSKLSRLNTTDYRITFGGDIYNIVAVDNLRFANSLIIIRAARTDVKN